jgi:PHP family Zn ribbon phosphoesterase
VNKSYLVTFSLCSSQAIFFAVNPVTVNLIISEAELFGLTACGTWEVTSPTFEEQLNLFKID